MISSAAFFALALLLSTHNTQQLPLNDSISSSSQSPPPLNSSSPAPHSISLNSSQSSESPPAPSQNSSQSSDSLAPPYNSKPCNCFVGDHAPCDKVSTFDDENNDNYHFPCRRAFIESRHNLPEPVDWFAIQRLPFNEEFARVVSLDVKDNCVYESAAQLIVSHMTPYSFTLSHIGHIPRSRNYISVCIPSHLKSKKNPEICTERMREAVIDTILYCSIRENEKEQFVLYRRR